MRHETIGFMVSLLECPWEIGSALKFGLEHWN